MSEGRVPCTKPSGSSTSPRTGLRPGGRRPRLPFQRRFVWCRARGAEGKHPGPEVGTEDSAHQQAGVANAAPVWQASDDRPGRRSGGRRSGLYERVLLQAVIGSNRKCRPGTVWYREWLWMEGGRLHVPAVEQVWIEVQTNVLDDFQVRHGNGSRGCTVEMFRDGFVRSVFISCTPAAQVFQLKVRADIGTDGNARGTLQLRNRSGSVPCQHSAPGARQSGLSLQSVWG